MKKEVDFSQTDLRFPEFASVAETAATCEGNCQGWLNSCAYIGCKDCSAAACKNKCSTDRAKGE